MQVQDDTRPRGPGRRQPPPAERRVEVVCVHHLHTLAPDHVRHLFGGEASDQ